MGLKPIDDVKYRIETIDGVRFIEPGHLEIEHTIEFAGRTLHFTRACMFEMRRAKAAKRTKAKRAVTTAASEAQK